MADPQAPIYLSIDQKPSICSSSQLPWSPDPRPARTVSFLSVQELPTPERATPSAAALSCPQRGPGLTALLSSSACPQRTNVKDSALTSQAAGHRRPRLPRHAVLTCEHPGGSQQVAWPGGAGQAGRQGAGGPSRSPCLPKPWGSWGRPGSRGTCSACPHRAPWGVCTGKESAPLLQVSPAPPPAPSNIFSLQGSSPP